MGGGKANLEGEKDAVALRTEINELKSQVAASRGKQEASRRINRVDGRNHSLGLWMGATSDPDIMYFHQAMKQADANNVLDAAHREFQDLLHCGVIKIVPAFLVPKGIKVFSAV
jgi:DNA-binding FadR family transcriptional regulator